MVIPEGAERIGDRWFWGSEIEGITFPTSVKEVGGEAFCGCKNLKRIIFSESSKLEKISEDCFKMSGIENLVLPASVKEVGARVF